MPTIWIDEIAIARRMEKRVKMRGQNIPIRISEVGLSETNPAHITDPKKKYRILDPRWLPKSNFAVVNNKTHHNANRAESTKKIAVRLNGWLFPNINMTFRARKA